MHRSFRQGFTLIEMAIVLVIVGLIAGAIIGGKSLIHAAQLQTVIDEEKTYNTAIQQFKDKYGELPGDFASAAKVWPSAVNGNGNNVIEYVSGAGASGAGVQEEVFQAWLHLQLAGMVQGNFTGAAGAVNGQDYQFGTNAPKSTFENTGWMAAYLDNSAGGSGHSPKIDSRKWLGVGGVWDTPGTPTWADDGFLSNADAYEIDLKIDDGKPLLGRVQAMGMDKPNKCTNAANNADVGALYVLSDASENACALLFSYELVTAKR